MRLPTILAGLGALPFMLGSLLLALGVNELPALGSTTEIVRSYSLTIAVFLCGIHWGQYLHDTRARDLNLLIISNVLTVICWLAFLAVTPAAFLVIVVATFLALLGIDHRLQQAGVITAAYFRMRLAVTAVVCGSLVLALFSLAP